MWVSFGTCVQVCEMGWLRLVGSLKLQVSFVKEPYKRDDILQKRPIILRSLLIEATPDEQLPLAVRLKRDLYTCGVLQCVAVCCSVLQCVAVCCSVLQCLAVCGSVLQCVAVCCSVSLSLTHVHTHTHTHTHTIKPQHAARGNRAAHEPATSWTGPQPFQVLAFFLFQGKKVTFPYKKKDLKRDLLM